MKTIELGNWDLTFETVESVALGAPVSLSCAGRSAMSRAQAYLTRCLHSGQIAYGVNTGFGALAEVQVSPQHLASLQRNLVVSHAAGIGQPLSEPETRAMMALRAQSLSCGHSGVRPEVVDFLVAMLNGGVHPIVPEKGSVGASGDLAPLAHVAATMIGVGDACLAGERMPAAAALARINLAPIVLGPKEGLGLLNGTQAMAAVGTLALAEAERLCDVATLAGAISLEGLDGNLAAFDPRVHAVRPHPGQRRVAAMVRSLCGNGPLHRSSGAPRMQDAYSLRCMPQVHGATWDTLMHCRTVLERELNSVTDNPLIFADTNGIVSGGNFHGQPLALALDFAAIAVAELGNLSERRTEQLVNPALSGLPPFLTQESGLNSGYMVPQLTAAALVNENKILCTPASVDSIPGSAGREDHVSMGMTSARKLRGVVHNVRTILAIELLCAAQAVHLRAATIAGAGVEPALRTIRALVPPLAGDRFVHPDIVTLTDLVASGRLHASLQESLAGMHL